MTAALAEVWSPVEAIIKPSENGIGLRYPIRGIGQARPEQVSQQDAHLSPVQAGFSGASPRKIRELQAADRPRSLFFLNGHGACPWDLDLT
jgi:hypothetical protein